MIAQGTDGLSRGIPLEGVMTGRDMLNFIDILKGAFERHLPLLHLIREFTGKDDLCPVPPEHWFVEGHGITGGFLDENNVWMPHHANNEETYL